MKNRWLKILLILLFAVIMPGIRPVYADESADNPPCSMDRQEEVKQELIEELRTSFNQFKSAVATYNPLAQTYMNNCLGESGNPGPQVRASLDDAVTARAAGVDIEDDSLYEYIGIPWGNVRGDTSACIQLLQEVKQAYLPAVDAYDNMRHRIQALKNPSASMCTCDKDGGKPNCRTIDKDTGLSEGQSGKCESFTGIAQRLSSCPLCGVFEAALNASARVAHIAWQSTAKPLSEVVIIFFLVVLAIESLKAIGSIGGFKLGSYLKSVFLIGLKIAITVTLLSNSQYIYTLFISPVIKGGLDMGLAIASASGNVQCDTTSSGLGIIASTELDESLFNQILHTVRCFGSSASTLPAVGMGLICHSAPTGIWGGDILPDLHMFLSGLIMLGFGLMIWLALSFYLIDCTVQIGMLSALVPLLVACWPFDLTKQYTSKGVKMLMNTFFNFALMGTVLLIGTAIISFALSGEGSSSMQELLTAVNNNEAEKLKQLASLDGIRVLMLLACSIFALKLIAKASSLAQQFSQGSGADTGSKMAGAAMGTATTALMGGAHSMGHLAGNLGSKAWEGSSMQAGLNGFMDGALEKRRNFLSTLGGMTPLGRFQNQQTGSGIPLPTGDGTPPSGGTPPTGGDGIPSTGGTPTPAENKALENMNPLNDNSQPGGDGTPPSGDGTPPAGSAKPSGKDTPTTTGGTPSSRAAAANDTELSNQAEETDETTPLEPQNQAEGDEPAEPQNSNGKPQKASKPTTPEGNPKAATTQHNNTPAGGANGAQRSQVTANSNPTNTEELRTDSATPASTGGEDQQPQPAAATDNQAPAEATNPAQPKTDNKQEPKKTADNKQDAVKPAATGKPATAEKPAAAENPQAAPTSPQQPASTAAAPEAQGTSQQPEQPKADPSPQPGGAKPATPQNDAGKPAAKPKGN